MRQTATFDYYYGMQAESYSFYRIPKVLFTSDFFKGLSCEAKVLYGLMLDRMSLSVKNRWFDDEDRVYIIFTVEDVIELLGCARQKAIKLLAELDTERGIGLIEKKRQGLGKPSIIYVKNFMFKIESDEETVPEERISEQKDAVNTADSQKYENHTSRGMKTILPEIPESNFMKYDNQTLGSMEIKLPEVPKSNSNNTDNNNTKESKNNRNHTYQSIRLSPDRVDEMRAYRMVIRENIEYDALCHSYDQESIDEIVELMTEVMMSKKPEIIINGESVPIEIVKNRFMKVNYNHIQYIFESMRDTTKKIYNIRQYLLTVIYNAPVTINHYYQAEVNHDMHG